MADMTDAQFRQKVLDVLNEKGAHIKEDIEQVTTIDGNVILPGYQVDGEGDPVKYVCAPMTVFATYAENAVQTIQSAWQLWFGTGDTSGIQKVWKDFYTQASGEWGPLKTAVESATQAANQAAGSVQQAVSDAQAATQAAQQATSDAQSATAGAERVNATLVGMTVTVTNRNGVSTQVNIGFEITPDHVYPSIAAMEADAANVLPGKFCMIATTDKTSEDNAQLWSRNSSAATSEHPFTFLSDLDQASSAAFADWLNNYKPVIEADHQTAENDHTTADQDHTRAGQDHTTADQDHTTAGQDHTRADQDHTTADQDHTTAGQDHTRAGQDHTTADQDHTTAGQDHTRADQDHTTADQDHTTAGQDHTRAGQDHTTADQDHTTAGQDHTRADEDHTTADSDHTTAGQDHDRAENMAAHPPYVADGTEEKPGDAGFYYQWDYDNQIYVKGIRISLDWDTMSDEAKAALAAEILASIAFDDEPTDGSNKAVRSSGIYTALAGKQDTLEFADDETCEDIIDELT